MMPEANAGRQGPRVSFLSWKAAAILASAAAVFLAMRDLEMVALVGWIAFSVVVHNALPPRLRGGWVALALLLPLGLRAVEERRETATVLRAEAILLGYQDRWPLQGNDRLVIGRLLAAWYPDKQFHDPMTEDEIRELLGEINEWRAHREEEEALSREP